MHAIFLVLSFLFSVTSLFSTVGILDNTFNTSGTVSTAIQTTTADTKNSACAVQQDGKIVVVGNANPGFAVARYTQEGVLDTTFNSGGSTPGTVVTTAMGITAFANGVVIDNQGRIVVCGGAGNGGIKQFVVARYLSNGLLDTTANGGSGFGNATAASATGYVATSMSGGTVQSAQNLALDASGNIVICGAVTIALVQKFAILRYTSNGVLDPTFNTNGYISTTVTGGSVQSAYGVAIDSSGKIVVCGNATISSAINGVILRYTSAGALDNTFGPGTSGSRPGYVSTLANGTSLVLYAVTTDSSSNILVCGTTTVSSAVRFIVMRYSSAGVLDTSGFGGGSGFSRSTFGSTSPTGYRISMESDGKILIGGGNDTGLFVARYTSAGSLDTTFNSAGAIAGYNSVSLSAVPGRTGFALQQNNELVVAGTAGGSFSTSRFVGDAAPQGCMDTTYNSTGTTPGYITDPTDATSSHKPEVKSLQILSSNSIFVLTEDLATTTKSQLVQIDSAGSTASANAIVSIDIAQIGGADVISDSHGRALVVGGNGSNGWIARYVPTAGSGSAGNFALDSAFNGGSIIVQTASPTTTAYSRVCEQASGNILAMGQNGTTGIIVAYNQDGTVNTSFGTSGVYSFATTTLTDMVVDSSSRIYVVGSVTSGNITLYRLLANGSGVDTSYNTTGSIDTAFASASYQGAKLAGMSSTTQATLVTVNSSTYQFEFKQYSSAGAAGSTRSIAQTTHLLTSPIITQLQLDSNNQPIYVGYGLYAVFAGRLTSALAIDTTFSPYSQLCPGIVTTMYNNNNPSRVANCIGIAPSGAIVFGGYENIDASNTIATIGQVVGNASYSERIRYPGAEIGQVDTAFGTSGALSLAASPASLTAGSAKAMYVLPSNKILVADTNGTNTVLGQLTSAYALDTAAFGSTTGLITLTGLATPRNIMIDVASNIYVVGDNVTPHGVVYKVASDGSSGGTVWATTTLTNGYNVCQQASGRILVCGYDSSYNSGAGSGVVVAYTPAGVVDTSFNPGGSVPGYWYTGVAHPITSMSVCSAATTADKILIAYESGTTAIVQRLLENGSALDSAFSFGTALTGVSAEDQIRMQQDVNGKVVLVVRTSTGFAASRYTVSGTDDVIAVSIAITNPSTASLKNILCVSNGTTLIAGMNTNGNKTEIARLTSAFALDTSFNYSSGILQAAVSPMIDFYGIDVTADQGIIVCGDNNATVASANPYMTRLFDDYVVTKVGQGATSTPAAGILDTTFNPAGTNAGFMNLHTQLATTQFATPNQAKNLLQLSTGSYFIAADDGTNSYVTKMSDDDVQVAAFNTTGVVTISSKSAVSQMLLTQSGELLVVGGSGSSGSNAGWMKLYNATTGALNTTFAPTDTLDAIFAVAQGTNGSIVVAGQDNGFGTLIAYNATTGAVDATFGVNGRYVTSYTAAINAMVIDADGFIYYTVNDNSNLATTIKLSPNAVQIKWTGSTTVTNSTISSNNHIAIDQNGNIVVVAVDTTTPQIVVKRYASSTGVESATYNLTNGVTSFTTPVVTSLLIDLNTSPGKIILTGYNNLGTPVPFILRMLANITGGLDTTFNTTGIQNYNTVTSGTTRAWYAGMINGNGKITVAGYAVLSATNTPYLMRVYGDEFIGQYLPAVAAGTPGTLNPNFGDPGFVELADLSGAGALAGQTPQVVVPIANGDYYVAFTDGHLIRLTNVVELDTTFAPFNTGFAISSTAGVQSMFIDGSSRLVLAGTNGGAAWLQRYNANSGLSDFSFNINAASALSVIGSTLGTVAIQQTLGRYILAGAKTGGNGALYAFTNTGAIDTTFNSGGTTPGVFDTGVATGVYALISDIFDRLIIAYKNGSGIDVVRLTSAGQIDTTFGTSGIITGAIANADDATQVHVSFDVSGNIVVAAHVSTGGGQVAVKAYTNSSGTVVETQFNITTLTSPVLTGLIATSDGNALLSGYQSGSNDMWVARVNNNSGAYQLDATFGTGGIFQFANDVAGTVTARNLTSIAIYPDGEIVTVGTETDTANSPNISPFISQAFNTPFTTQIAICQDSKAVGTNDTTLGASSTAATALGVVFYASSGATDATSGQVARAIALQDDANILVAVDGAVSNGGTTSDIFLKMFTIDGTPQTTFGTAGQQTILSSYQNQFVNDMVTFSTVAGVHKAIIAGYVTNTNLGSARGSLLLQYNLDTQALDAFGGFNGNVAGTACGDCKQINAVGLQSTGRIIATGLDQNDAGVLLGYTTAGKLDTSFGVGGGYFATGTTGLYTHAIDTQNRIVIAYQDGSTDANFARFLADGSGLDTSFAGGSINSSQATYGTNGMRVAVDTSNNVYAVAVASTYASLTVYAYSGTDGSTLYSAFTTNLSSSLTHFVISKLLIDEQGRVIVVGYDTNGAAADQLVIVCVLADLSGLDPSFNTTGYVKYAVSTGTTSQVATDAMIHPDGRILIIGSEV